MKPLGPHWPQEIYGAAELLKRPRDLAPGAVGVRASLPRSFETLNRYFFVRSLVAEPVVDCLPGALSEWPDPALLVCCPGAL